MKNPQRYFKINHNNPLFSRTPLYVFKCLPWMARQQPQDCLALPRQDQD